MRVIAFPVACILGVTPAVGADIDTELQVQLQSLMLSYTDSVLVDGGYTYIDTADDALKTVFPANVHPFIVTLGDDYVVCSEMIDENGDAVTADFVVRRIGDEYRVVQMLVNDRAALQGAMKKLSN